MSLKIQINRKAERDLDEIAYYIASENRSASDQLIDEFHRVFTLLSEYPGIGRMRSELSTGFVFICRR
jgi:plasmid stabilization system protein ParE